MAASHGPGAPRLKVERERELELSPAPQASGLGRARETGCVSPRRLSEGRPGVGGRVGRKLGKVSRGLTREPSTW